LAGVSAGVSALSLSADFSALSVLSLLSDFSALSTLSALSALSAFSAVPALSALSLCLAGVSSADATDLPYCPAVSPATTAASPPAMAKLTVNSQRMRSRPPRRLFPEVFMVTPSQAAVARRPMTELSRKPDFPEALAFFTQLANRVHPILPAQIIRQAAGGGDVP
jgi:hypothetical protein